jgi:RNA polymerase sigma-70 factor (ECF subfamily)
VHDTDIESTLLTLVADGDTAAFERLYGLMGPRIFGLVLRVLRDRHQAEEVTQEVFLETWTHAARYDSERGSAAAWMLRLAHGRAVDRVRASEASGARDLRVGIRDFGVVDSPEDLVASRIDSAAVERALAELPEPQRRAIILTHLAGYTQVEAAEILNVPLGTVKTRVREGLGKMRRHLEAAA